MTTPPGPVTFEAARNIVFTCFTKANERILYRFIDACEAERKEARELLERMLGWAGVDDSSLTNVKAVRMRNEIEAARAFLERTAK